MREKRTEHINMKIAPSVKELCRKLAEQEGRTVSNYIEQLIIREAKDKGLI